MKAHLQRETDRLKRQILTLSADVEAEVRKAVRAVEDREAALAEAVIAGEDHTNAMEVDIEEECLKILALYQPVASDLRYIVAVLKINQDLERIGDLAVHIAERALWLCGQPPLGIPFRLGPMADGAQRMLKEVLDAFVNLDAAAARSVCAEDSAIDQAKREIFRQAKAAVLADPSRLDALLQVMNIARHMERIADHVTNIAEDLIYLVEGRIVRHTREVSDREPPASGPAR
jgi:phosphate transport system protein